jgi:hypothetical protein
MEIEVIKKEIANFSCILYTTIQWNKKIERYNEVIVRHQKYYVITKKGNFFWYEDTNTLVPTSMSLIEYMETYHSNKYMCWDFVGGVLEGFTGGSIHE